MKYDIQFTNQFKKDLKLAKKQNKNLDKLFEVIVFWRMAVRWKQNTEITILQATIKVLASATLNQTGCLFMRFRIMF